MWAIDIAVTRLKDSETARRVLQAVTDAMNGGTWVVYCSNDAIDTKNGVHVTQWVDLTGDNDIDTFCSDIVEAAWEANGDFCVVEVRRANTDWLEYALFHKNTRVDHIVWEAGKSRESR